MGRPFKGSVLTKSGKEDNVVSKRSIFRELKTFYGKKVHHDGTILFNDKIKKLIKTLADEDQSKVKQILKIFNNLKST